jgi:hypothetical protein
MDGGEWLRQFAEITIPINFKGGLPDVDGEMHVPLSKVLFVRLKIVEVFCKGICVI